MLFTLFFLYLLFFPQAAASSARDGLLLWYRSVLPVLFPFMFLSALAVRLVQPERLPRTLTRPVCRLFNCSACCAFAILAGFLCGLPMGAKLTADLCREEKISPREAWFLHSFINNMSPGFIVSYLAVGQMRLPGCAGWFLLQILGAPLLFGLFAAHAGKLQKREGEDSADSPWLSGSSKKPAPCPGFSFSLVDDCIYDAIGNTLRLCAYIVLFTILSGAALQILPATNPAVLLLISVIEVTSGIRFVAESALPFTAKYIIVSALAAFGGLSALAQTAGIAHMDRALLIHYTKSRVKITLLATLLAAAVCLLRPYFVF